MARKNKNTVNYFPHLINEGKTMFIIEQKYKNDGYATWFKILERLGKSENHFINLSDNKEMIYLASKCNVEKELLVNIINDLVDLEQFDKFLWQKHSVIWCQKFTDNIADLYRRRDAEMPTINLICCQLNIKYQQNGLNGGKSTHIKRKESKVKEIIESVRKFYDLEISKNTVGGQIENYKLVVEFLFGKNETHKAYEHILEVPEQLSYEQFEKLWVKLAKTGKTFSHYLGIWANNKTYSKNKDTIYFTLSTWMSKDIKNV